MAEPRFLQIHTLTAYTAALLNRDDSGLAKRLPYGGATRTRVSSQCLKRHWRMAEDPHALSRIDGFEGAFRSRELVTKKVITPVRAEFGDVIADALEPSFQKALYGDKGDKKANRQTLLMGAAELDWLASEARRLAGEAGGDEKTAMKLAEEWAKAMKGNLKAMVEAARLPGGLIGALFGRMVTSDPEANITAPVHVAHAFTVHAEESESDYFTAVDDLGEEEPGADTIQETELTSGLYYGYVVIDLPGLRENLGENSELAGQVVHNLIHLIAEVSPGAKLGSTAPYGRAGLVLVEAGDRQPRSLAEAFRKPVAPDMDAASAALERHLNQLDKLYETGEARRLIAVVDAGWDGVTRDTLKGLASWAGEIAAGRGVRP
ncbi:MAG: type I-E CRISPR-associated protein Cas7/Cse4/CasC [Alphaproteobacteria bacterium]|nr:MAG: type I-E CRISPR-associated protein Cas7/Cse4/CasC [Alphaproteobacteria bacterium]